MNKKTLQDFRNKWILFDTNILVKLSQYAGKGYLDDFLSELTDLNIAPIVDEYTLFEYVRGSRTKTHLEDKKVFVDYVCGGEEAPHQKMILPSSKKILDAAQGLAILYGHQDKNYSNQISLVDCFVGAQLMTYKKMLCLATTDNKDYPLCVFDRIQVKTFDTEKEIINIGIYAFNQDKYDQCEAAFLKTL